MARTTASRPYKNKNDVLRISVLLDYAMALRIATGSVEDLNEVARVLTRAVDLYELKNDED